MRATKNLAVAPGRSGLPATLSSGLEHLSGINFSTVRVYRNSPKPAKLNALACTQGRDIHLGPGQERHLPHEAWHVVQQQQGRVSATNRVGDTRVNDDRALEHEADRMGAKAQRTSLNPATGPAKTAPLHPGAGVIQRRVVNPAEIKSRVGSADVDTAEIVGLRTSLTDTLTRLFAVKQAETEALFTPKPASAADIKTRVDAMDRDSLALLAGNLQTTFPSLEFNTSLFDVSAVGRGAPSSAKTYWDAVKKVAVKWLLEAKADDDKIQKVFGDGTLNSVKSKDAAKKAKVRFQNAADALDKATNIKLDSSGISNNLSLGGYAVFPDTVFMVVENMTSPTKDEQLTAAHEGAHLAKNSIKDDLGYASRVGEAFRLASIDTKLNNADHYAQVIAHREGIGTRLTLPFSPRVVGGGPLADPRTTTWDTADTQALREEISTETRELWDATVDGFLESHEFRKAGTKMPDKKVENASKLMNMTLHRPKVNHTEITDLDLSLAESTVRRVTALGGEVDAVAVDTTKVTFDFLKSKVTSPFSDAVKKKTAFEIILEKSKTSAKLKPEDIAPTPQEHLGGLRNRKWRSTSPVF